MEEKLECAARVTVRSAAARSIKSYKGGDAVLSGNKGENDLHFWDQSIAHYRALPVRRPASPAAAEWTGPLEPAILARL